jgi:hypothetical protein
MELNRGGVGVPLEKLARVVNEAQKFFRMLGEDVRIPKGSGEWLGFDFDHKSLNFTAEFVGPVDPAQVRAFYAAFDGTTHLRRATIAQFARIADAIGEDELIGFGLYVDDREIEPSEWRSLSKREALRITEEIRLLLDQADGASRMPAALDPNAAASLFKDRRDHGGADRRMEGLAARVERLETEVAGHSGAIQNLRGVTVNTEQNLQKLLVAVDTFCDKATRQMERLPAPEPIRERFFGWRIPVTIAAILAIGGWLLFHGGIEQRDATSRVQAADPIKRESAAPARVAAQPPALKPVRDPAVVPAATAVPAAAVAPATTPPRPSTRAPEGVQRIELKALEPTWIAVYVDNKLSFSNVLAADQTKNIETAETVRVRLGNAGGVEITANGKPVGAIGRKGQVRIVEFSRGGFHIVPIEAASAAKTTP